MLRSRHLLPALLIVLFALVLPLHAFVPVKSLSPRFHHWLEEEVPYIISTEERRQFLDLKSDEERENFIKVFWDLRNPDAGSDINTYKQEHYRRLAYANEHFGNLEAQNGWRTDQGRIYVTLGEPQQRTTYPNARNVRPLIIWFYESPTPALPSHFYVIFYKRSAGDPYTLYSPYQDGPSRLTTGLEDLNVQKRSLQTIRKSLGDEVARMSLSLIPTEPVDLNDYSPSMSSDVMLSTIKGLADNQMTRQMLEARRGREVVSSRLLLSPAQAELQAASFRESEGKQTVSYLFLPHEPIRGLIGALPDGKQGYSLMLDTTVATHDGKRVYQTETALQSVVTDVQAGRAHAKLFGVEERLPLAPGDYTISSVLTNKLTHVALQESQSVVVPDLSSEDWSMSKLVAFSQHTASAVSGKLPFTIAGVRFVPRGVGDVALHSSEPLWITFQLWGKPSPATAERPSHLLKITYSYGSLQGGQAPQTETEEVDTANADALGDLVTGRKIETSGLTPGIYRLVVTALDEETQRRAYSTMQFRIVPDSDPTDMWTAFNVDAGGSRSDAMDDYKRGLSALAQSQTDVAAGWFHHALADDAQYLPALDRLVDLLSHGSRYAEVAALSTDHPPTHELNERTAILMAEANGQVGKSDAGIHILESELQFQAPNANLYAALAKLYQQNGNMPKSEEYKRKAAILKN